MHRASAVGILVLLLTVFASEASAQLWRGRGRMDGTVMDADGAPIEGVVVKAYLPEGDGGREVASNDDGYLDLLASYPEAHQLHALVARAYHADQQLDDAVRHLRLALEADPANPAVAMLLGSVLVERGDTEEGRRVLASLDQDSIEDPVVFVNLGIEQLNQAEPAAAMPHFDNAIERFPASPEAYYFRGITHLQLGDQAAAADLERFVTLAPDAPEAQTARDMLEQLR